MITIDNLDYTIRDVAFEGFMLNYYKNLWEWNKANCDVAFEGFMLNYYKNLWEWNKAHSSSASDFLTLWHKQNLA